jgi:hypothetical protein
MMTLKFYEDQDRTLPINVSSFTFKLMAKNSTGVTQFTFTNVDFALQANTNERKITLTSATTTSYPLGEFAYDLQVTTPTGNYTYMVGYIQVQEQITS